MTDLKQLVGIVALVLFAGCDKPWCKDGDETLIDMVLRFRAGSDGEPCADFTQMVGQCETWRSTQESRYIMPYFFSFTEAATGDCLAVYGGLPEIVDGVQFLDCSESTLPGCCDLVTGIRCTDET